MTSDTFIRERPYISVEKAWSIARDHCVPKAEFLEFAQGRLEYYRGRIPTQELFDWLGY